MISHIYLVGPSGSGKTVLATMLARKLRLPFVDTDAEILKKTGHKLISNIFAELGEKEFRQLEANAISTLMRKRKSSLVATGGGLPAIPLMMDTLKATGTTIYLKASVNTLWRRLNQDPQELADRPLLRSKGDLLRLMLARESVYNQADIIIPTDEMVIEDVMERLYDSIKRLVATTRKCSAK